MSIICSNCKTKNKSTSTYCVNCGSLLPGATETIVLCVSYDLVLRDAGTAKLQVVKAVKETFDLGLKEAKDLVDGAPSVLVEGITKAEAEDFKNTIEKAGAVVELRKHVVAPKGYRLIRVDDQDALLTKEEVETIKKINEALDGVVEIKPSGDINWNDLKRVLCEYKKKYDNDNRSLFDKFSWSDIIEGNEDEVWLQKIKEILWETRNPSKVEISKDEYERLRRHADMSLWDKFKDMLGL